MEEATVNNEFNNEFQKWVIDEIQEYMSPGLYSKRPRVRNHWDEDEKQRINEVARSYAGKNKLPEEFLEWFSVAYMAGLVVSFHIINNEILLRTPVGYEYYSTLSKRFPAEFLKAKLDERSRQYEFYVKHASSTGLQSLDRPIIEITLFQQEPASEQAKKLVAKKEIKKYLCAALKSVSDDVFEISKVITPILLSLSIAGTISIPLSPLLYASMAILISKMGIAMLCAECDVKKSTRKD